MVGHQKRAPKTGAFENGPQSGVFLKKPAIRFCRTDTGGFEYDNFIHNTTLSGFAHLPDTPCLPLRILRKHCHLFLLGVLLYRGGIQN